jgi:hypothetical protein
MCCPYICVRGVSRRSDLFSETPVKEGNVADYNGLLVYDRLSSAVRILGSWAQYRTGHNVCIFLCVVLPCIGRDLAIS